MRVHFFAALVGIALVLPLVSSAQSFDVGDAGGEPFTVSVYPQYPAPYGTATISLLSSSLDLANATISVSVAGKKIYSGSVRPVAVALGRAGSVASVSVTVSSGGANYSKALSLQPQDVVLVAEPVSSAPPLYPGKALVALEGRVRVIALANFGTAGGGALDPSKLVYTWTVNDVRIANSSGIGKDAIMVASPIQYRASDVSVAVASSDGSMVGGAALSLAATDPFVRIYENDPLLGIRYDRELSGHYAIAGTESALYAAPFALPTTNGAPLLKWFLNGAAAQTGSLIALRPSGKGEGGASLSLVASAGRYTSASASLSLSFGGKSGANFFGL
jgi:hypothetical protein